MLSSERVVLGASTFHTLNDGPARAPNDRLELSCCIKRQRFDNTVATMSTNDPLKQAIVDNVEHGVYPEPDISSAELPSNLLPALLADLQKARDEVKVCNGNHLSCLACLTDRGRQTFGV